MSEITESPQNILPPSLEEVRLQGIQRRVKTNFRSFVAAISMLLLAATSYYLIDVSKELSRQKQAEIERERVFSAYYESVATLLSIHATVLNQPNLTASEIPEIFARFKADATNTQIIVLTKRNTDLSNQISVKEAALSSTLSLVNSKESEVKTKVSEIAELKKTNNELQADMKKSPTVDDSRHSIVILFHTSSYPLTDVSDDMNRLFLTHNYGTKGIVLKEGAHISLAQFNGPWDSGMMATPTIEKTIDQQGELGSWFKPLVVESRSTINEDAEKLMDNLEKFWTNRQFLFVVPSSLEPPAVDNWMRPRDQIPPPKRINVCVLRLPDCPDTRIDAWRNFSESCGSGVFLEVVVKSVQSGVANENARVTGQVRSWAERCLLKWPHSTLIQDNARKDQ